MTAINHVHAEVLEGGFAPQLGQRFASVLNSFLQSLHEIKAIWRSFGLFPHLCIGEFTHKVNAGLKTLTENPIRMVGEAAMHVQAKAKGRGGSLLGLFNSPIRKAVSCAA